MDCGIIQHKTPNVFVRNSIEIRLLRVFISVARQFDKFHFAITSVAIQQFRKSVFGKEFI